MSGRLIEPLYDHWKLLDKKELEAIVLDFKRFCAEGILVINKDSKRVSFVLNEAQVVTAEIILRAVLIGGQGFLNLVIHKSRQMGISLVLMGIEQYLSTRKRNFHTQHIMPTDADVKDLKDFKLIPMLQGTHPQLLPTIRTTTNRVSFIEWGGTKLNSTIDFRTAQSHGAGHGQTNNIVILDEYAKYRGVEEFERGILPTLSKGKDSGTMLCYVSTAMGENHFKEKCDIARANPDEWTYIFLPWHMLKEYEREPEPGSRLANLESLTEYELSLIDIFEKEGYPVDSWVRKLCWYEYTFRTECAFDKRKMHDNYPSTSEESFMASGSTVLPIGVLAQWAATEVPYDYIEFVQSGPVINTIVVDGSPIKRFKPPIMGHKYTIGADPGDGITEGDPSAAVVIDLNTMDAVCSLVENVEQTEFAEVLALMGKYYNNAVIVVESNKGSTTIEWLKMYNYPSIYIDPFKTTNSRIVYGIYMTRPVKNEAVNRMRFLMNNGIYKDYDQDFIKEAKSFVWRKTQSGLSKAEAAGSAHDDQVMARMIAIYTINMNKWREYKSYGKEK